jgi:hypothetical protein
MLKHFQFLLSVAFSIVVTWACFIPHREFYRRCAKIPRASTVSNWMECDMTIRALGLAVAQRLPPKGCIHYTDRNAVRTSIKRVFRSMESK